MTEAQWLACSERRPMFEFLGGKASDRQLRLFAAACCRHLWQLLHDERSRLGVETTERFVDGKAQKNEWRRAALRARNASSKLHAKCLSEETSASKVSYYAAAAASLLCEKTISYRGSADWAAVAIWFHSGIAIETTEAAQAHLLRCIFGNPFRPVSADPVWLTSDVVALAEGVYRECAFDRMPILADALQDAGCDNADILDHCRGPGPHVRGCWVVDAILGKE